MQQLLDAGLLHGDCLTVTGQTMAENLAELDPPAPDGAVVHPLSDADPRAGRHRGPPRLARAEGRGGEGRRHRRRCASRARPACSTARTRRWRRSSPGKIKPGDVVVIRYEGPKGGPGHARDARDHRRDEGRRARRRRRARSPTAGSPAARTASASATSRPKRSTAARSRSSPTATASSSTSVAHTIDLLVDDAELARREANWKLPEPRYTSGVPRQVRQARPGRRDRRDHQHVVVTSVPEILEVEAARARAR